MSNLLRKKWLRVRTKNGEQRWIAPSAISDPEVLELAPPRPDFKAALMEWLIGLLQTVFASSPREWKELLRNPPSEEALRRVFVPHEKFFELFGERVPGRGLFMQDLTMSDRDKPVYSPVVALLMEQPGENTLKNNTDLFVHRGQIESLCPACAAAAIYTLQAFAPSGGKGHRTSLRGGGPLSTLLTGRNLWESVWLNVLPTGPGPDALTAAPPEADLPGQVYPWAAPTRTSEKGEITHPEDVHPLHAYWSMPRRLLLETAPATRPCDLCGRRHELAVVAVLSRPSGYNYGPTWQHPLTPYMLAAGKAPLSIKGQNNSAAYSNWLGIVYGEPKESKTGATRPARCLRREALKEAYHIQQEEQMGGVHVAGYNMSKMKAVSWCEHVFPIISVPETLEDDFAPTVYAMVQAADQARRTLGGCLKEALVNDAGKKQASIENVLLTDAADAVWIETEADFYRQIAKLANLQPQTEAWRDTLFAWGKILLLTLNRLYDTFAWDGFPPERMEQRVIAQGKLNAFTIKDLRNRAMYPPKEAK